VYDGRSPFVLSGSLGVIKAAGFEFAEGFPVFDGKLLSRTVIAGGILAVVAIGLFLLLWTAFSGLDDFVRLMLSVCIPPAALALIAGVFFLVTRSRAGGHRPPDVES
jgi:hypothetical protein